MAAAVLRSVMNIARSSNPACPRAIHTTPSLGKIVSGKHKRTKERNKPLTYEQANLPTQIAHRKSWNSWNTTTLHGGMMKSQILNDDIIIRKFLVGTFHNMVFSEIIIKRQHNIIRLAFICCLQQHSRNISFLIGYSEEILGYIFQCPVKIEPQFIRDRRAVNFTYV